MADTDKEAGTTIVPRLHEFLPKVHQELLEGRKGAHRAHRTRPLEVGLGARQGVCRAQTTHGRGCDPRHPKR